MCGIICCASLISAISVCSDAMAKRSQHNSGGERVTAKSRPMMNLIARTPSHVSSSTSVSPVKRSCGSQDPWSSIAKEDRSVDLINAQIHSKPPIIIAMSKLWKASLRQATQSGMTTVLGLLKRGKTDIETYERSWGPDETSWRVTREVRPGFSHEETLHDGTADIRNGETLRDGSGQLVNFDSQEVANSQNFIMGNEETELELSVESRSFANRVNDQVRKKRQNNFECFTKWRKILWFGECLWL